MPGNRNWPRPKEPVETAVGAGGGEPGLGARWLGGKRRDGHEMYGTGEVQEWIGDGAWKQIGYRGGVESK